jgi:hypothetical protein
MRREHKHYTREEKVAILRQHLLDKLPNLRRNPGRRNPPLRADAYLLLAWVWGCAEGLVKRESSNFGFTTTFSMKILCVTL